MESFCGSPIWDSNSTWNTNSPHFTSCFEKTILVWIPTAFLSLFSAVQIYSALKLQPRKNQFVFSVLGLVREAIPKVLVILEIIDFSLTFRKIKDPQFKIYPADRAEPIIKLVTFGLAAFLQILTKRKGIASSAILFVFWILTAICSLPEFLSGLRSLPLEGPYTYDKINIIVTLIGYPLIVLELILSFFADKVAIPPLDENNSDKEVENVEKKPCPQKSSSIPNQLTSQWMYPLLWKGYRKGLEFSDLWDLNDEDRSSVVTRKFNKYWKTELDCAKTWISTDKKSLKQLPPNLEKNGKGTVKNKEGDREIASVLPALWKSNWHTIVTSGIFKLVQDLLQFVSPLLLSLLIAHLGRSGNDEDWKGFLFMGALFVTVTLQTLCNNYQTYLTFLIGMRLRCALVEAVYQKSLIVSNKARRELKTGGEITNLMSVDTQRFQDFMIFVHHIWSAPLQIVLSIYFLWNYLGVATISGVVILVILIPANVKVAVLLRTLRMEQMKKKDERVRLINEMLSSIKVLKLYAWEPSFEDRIKDIRQKELKILRRLAYINALVNSFWFTAPVLVTLASFATFVLIDDANVLDAQKIFVSLTLFNIMRLPMALFPIVIGHLVQTHVSLKRINQFMNAEEINHDAVLHNYSEQGNLVSVEGGNFTWGETRDTPTLRNINLRVKKGSLVAVVGTVGSGKSSLLSAILGEMEKTSGWVNTYGSVGYVAQQAWIQNATLRENILFGREFDPISYSRIIEACALKPDIRILPGGDKTEIGEKGINLSGGQKQRVALARAVYSDADIYLFDDPLSAVDSHVGKQLFEKVIGPQGMLLKKTRIVVTHGIAYLPYVDHIVVMNDGEITESGTYSELLKRKGAFADFIVQHASPEDLETASSSADHITRKNQHISRKFSYCRPVENAAIPSTSRRDSVSSINSLTSSRGGNINTDFDITLEPEANPSNLIGIEQAETGNVKSKVYAYYIKIIGFVLVSATVVSFTMGHGFSVCSKFWLTEWSALPTINGTQDVGKRNLYLAVYGVLGLGQSIAMYLADLALLLGCLKAAAVLHNNMLTRILRSPMSFFDATPLGRIVNRFSKDLDIPDTLFGDVFFIWFSSVYRVIGSLIVISINTPIFLTTVLPIVIIYIAVQRFYIVTSRQLKRMESVSRSPIFSHFSETLAGLPTIRAFKCQDQFLTAFEKNLDKNLGAYFPFICTTRWLSTILECIGNLVVLFATLFALLNQTDGGTLGLSVSDALLITANLNYLVRQTLEVETNIVSVERIKEYSEIPQEAAWHVPSQKPEQEWPQAGNIIFNNFQMRYREDLDYVLLGVTCNIRPGEKVGIVGRTGAGKSSLTLGLFRIVEAAGGSIVIDGKDISKMGLQDIRGNLTIIPQDPVMFVGTLRFNLDPWEHNSDDVIWHALEHAHLKDFVTSLPGGLNAIVTENGENFSVGQMQLVCLARALLRKTKILILDEATAAVDLHTDELIQKTIRTEFRDCTILTIAHRLNTIMDSDRVMVLDKGEICEFDSPKNLLSHHGSIFYNLAKDAGLL